MNRKIGTYKIPSEFKDEDKWFKWFTIPQLLALGGSIAVCVIVYRILAGIHMAFIGACLDIVILVVAGLCIFAPIPNDKYLLGGGQPFRVILVRIVWKRLPSNKKIYVRNYDEENES